MKASRRIAVGPVVAVLLSSAPAPAGDGSEFQKAWSAFEAFYRSACAQRGIVGSGIALVRDGRIVARANYGLTDRATQRPVDDDTIFHWASITKTFTGIAIMQLRDRGLLNLDHPAVRYVPELRAVHDRFGDASEITLRHLMTHSAGFRGPTWPWGGDQDWHPFEPTRWEQLVGMLPYTQVEFQPGSRFSYSNPGIVFLGRTIELLTGEDYEVHIDKDILRPLGMHRSYFDRAPRHLLGHRSHSYYLDDQGLREAPFDFDTGITVSNGGLMAPIGDMAKYLSFLIGSRGPEQPVYEGVLRRSSLEEMFAPLMPSVGPDAAGEAIGLLFFVEQREGRRLIGHSGSQGGFISHIYLDPEARAAWVVAFNTEAWAGRERDTPITRQLDAELRDFLLKNVLPRLP